MASVTTAPLTTPPLTARRIPHEALGGMRYRDSILSPANREVRLSLL